MQLVQIDERGEAIHVKSPYHPGFVKKARDLHGKWIDPAWVFDRRNREYVEESLRQVYGYASMDEVGEVVTVRMNLSYFDDGPALYFLGRLICARKARDYRVRLGDDVIVLEGGFPSSGGSMKNPRCHWKEDTIVELKDVPRVLWDRLDEKWKVDAVELVEPTSTPPADARTMTDEAEIKSDMAELLDRITRRDADIERFRATMLKVRETMRPLLGDDEYEDLIMASQEGQAATIAAQRKDLADYEELKGKLEDILAAADDWSGD